MDRKHKEENERLAELLMKASELPGVKIEVGTENLDGLSKDALCERLDELQEKMDDLEISEPEDDFGEEHEKWEDELEYLEEAIDEIESMLEDMEEGEC